MEFIPNLAVGQVRTTNAVLGSRKGLCLCAVGVFKPAVGVRYLSPEVVFNDALISSHSGVRPWLRGHCSRGETSFTRQLRRFPARDKEVESTRTHVEYTPSNYFYRPARLPHIFALMRMRTTIRRCFAIKHRCAATIVQSLVLSSSACPSSVWD